MSTAISPFDASTSSRGIRPWPSSTTFDCEIPVGGQLKPQRHVYEELIFILSGRGSTSVWLDAKKKNSFEWQAGSLFAIPLNCTISTLMDLGRNRPGI